MGRSNTIDLEAQVLEIFKIIVSDIQGSITPVFFSQISQAPQNGTPNIYSSSLALELAMYTSTAPLYISKWDTPIISRLDDSTNERG